MEILIDSVDSVELRVVKWHDNQAVTLLPTSEVINLTKELLRWDRKGYTSFNCKYMQQSYGRR